MESLHAQWQYILDAVIAQQHSIHGPSTLPLPAVYAACAAHNDVLKVLGIDFESVRRTIHTLPQGVLQRIHDHSASLVSDTFREQVQHILSPRLPFPPSLKPIKP